VPAAAVAEGVAEGVTEGVADGDRDGGGLLAAGLCRGLLAVGAADAGRAGGVGGAGGVAGTVTGAAGSALITCTPGLIPASLTTMFAPNQARETARAVPPSHAAKPVRTRVMSAIMPHVPL
jgi:hypothetical protein